jgi:hypothetical protein
VGVHADVEIKLLMDRAGGDATTMVFGHDEELTIDFCDLGSLERLAAVATDGVRQLRERVR